MTREPTLFPGVDAGSRATDGHSLARRGDPPTSKQAAAEIAPHLGDLQARVVEALRGRGGRTATELTSLEGIGDPRQFNRRLPELVKAGIVVVGATRPCRVTGKSARTYWLVEDIKRSGA